jgi:hypothetical protein
MGMEQFQTGMESGTTSILNMMQMCCDEVFYPDEKIFNDYVRREFVEELFLRTFPNLTACFEAWTWVLTSANMPLQRHVDAKNCKRKGYKSNCVWSCVFFCETCKEVVRLTLMGFSRDSVGNYFEKQREYAYDASHRINETVESLSGKYESLILTPQ